jgi:hypothetical protein
MVLLFLYSAALPFVSMGKKHIQIPEIKNVVEDA